ncbi:hypothetical protein TrLO_g1229 [Triparma laevis f. longispina]|uniref:Uncharacterized protein n=1 Tax=Triparma laevis f. longispina TaxID=1714387 RepID=A0A9W7B212_9STRA|nr:hypothetical protein TrLO_g1229 [Triparma laevis f. longispina]
MGSTHPPGLRRNATPVCANSAKAADASSGGRHGGHSERATVPRPAADISGPSAIAIAAYASLSAITVQAGSSLSPSLSSFARARLDGRRRVSCTSA